MADSIAAGYGNSNVEQLIFSDQQGLGYGDLISDTLALSDSEILVIGINKNVTDTLTLSDAQYLGYGFAITDTLVLLDTASFTFGLTQSITETLTISDFQSLGYGFLISDQLVLSDSTTIAIVESKNLTDTLTTTDSMLLGYGFAIAETLTLSDALELGIGYQPVEELFFLDYPAIGYGDLISDTMTLSDAFAYSAGQPSISLTLSDTISQSDSLGAGYGSSCTEAMSSADAIAFIEAFDVLIADATPQMLDALLALLAGAMSIEDQMVFSEQMGLMYGLLVNDQLVQSENLIAELLAVIFLALQDSETANWFETVLLEFVYAPGAITLLMLQTLEEMVLNKLAAQGVLQLESLDVQVLPPMDMQPTGPQMTFESISCELQQDIELKILV